MRRGRPRSELSSLLPLAILLVAILSTFTLFSYRTSVLRLVEEERLETEALARRLSIRLAATERGIDEELRPLGDWMVGVAVLDRAGRPVARVGPVSVLDEAPGSGAVRGSATYLRDGQLLTVRVERAATLLRSRQRSLGLLTPLILGVDLAVLVLVLVFVRRRLVPIDRVLERARSLGASAGSFEHEIESVVSLVERALDVLASASSDPLVALGSTLGSQLESGVVLCDAEGRVLAVNARGLEILGIEPPRPSTPVEDALAPHQRFAQALRQTVTDDEPVQRAEIQIQTADGRRALGFTVHPLRRSDGEARGYLVLFADLTDMQRREAESRLAESLARLGEITAGVAHELRNSLASLAGHLTLVERATSPRDREESLAELRHETAHLQRVVDDFLSFARPGSVRLEAVDLVALAHRAAADPSHGAPVRVDAPERPVLALGDRQLVERVLQNLTANAVAATEALEADAEAPPEPVLLRVVDEDPVRVEVLDRGPGIPSSIAETVFDPFVSGRAGGTGLGLAIARRIVELHGGEIDLGARRGGGTRATVRWPRASDG